MLEKRTKEDNEFYYVDYGPLISNGERVKTLIQYDKRQFKDWKSVANDLAIERNAQKKTIEKLENIILRIAGFLEENELSKEEAFDHLVKYSKTKKLRETFGKER